MIYKVINIDIFSVLISFQNCIRILNTFPIAHIAPASGTPLSALKYQTLTNILYRYFPFK